MQKNLVGKSEQGFGLLEIIIAAGLLALIVAVMNQNIVFSINSQRSVELRGDKEDVKRRLVDYVDCNKTLTAVPDNVCTQVGLPIDLKTNSTNPTIIRKEGTTIGSWTYRAYCVSADGKINVKAFHFKKGRDFQTPQIDLNDATNFIADPLTKNLPPIIDSNPKSKLFDDGAELCLRNKKLVPFYSSYPSGQSITRQTPGKPMFVMIFNPQITPNHAYCMKTRDMPGIEHLCGENTDKLNDAKIQFGLNDFTVSGSFNTANSPGSYPNFVYFGFAEVSE